MVKKTDTRIIIIGAGMAGLSLGALLGQRGIKVTIIDREDPGAMATMGFDPRTVALSRGTREVLAPLQIWDQMLPHATAITRIDVQEGHDPFILNFDMQDVGAEAFGWIFPNHIVRKTLYDVARNAGVNFVTGVSLKSVTQDDDRVTATLSDGTDISGQLLVAADGRHSRVRALLGIDTVNLNYKHVALVGLIAHEKPHHGLALERFYPEGPFAALPFIDLPDGRHSSAIVWSRHSKNKDVPAPDVLHDALAPMLDARYGAFEVFGKWGVYPLSLHHAKEMIAPRVALISDAAHAMHPIAGQGLNVGMRDVGWLAQNLPQQGDAGDMEFLTRYQRARRFDVFTMMAATDMLARLFGNRLPGLRWARSAGLGLVDRLPPLKRFFMRKAMGQ